MVELASITNRDVLAVDDEPRVLSALARMLQIQDFQVTQAPSGEAGLTFMSEREFSLILSDNIMPGMKGLEFLAEAMKRSPESRRILVTGYTDLQQAVDALNQGVVNRYVQKPWMTSNLAEIVRSEWNLYAQSRVRVERLRQVESFLNLPNSPDSPAGSTQQAGKPGVVGIAGWLPGRTTAVVLHGDVVGFSRLVGTDPVYALNLLRQSQGLIAGIVVRHNGRIVNAVGDCFLAEFHRAVDAVACACEMQQDLKRLNQPRPEESRMRFRLGINSGIVLQNGDDLFGDCVNVAARVQVLAAPDGICIAESVYREIEGELPYKFKSLGLQSLKNITEPVEVFQITE